MSAAYEATAAPVSFSARLVADFARDGFVVVRSFFNAFQVESMQRRLDAYVREVVPRLPKDKALYERSGQAETLKYLSGIDVFDPAFFGRLYVGEQLVGLAELLLDGPVRGDCLTWFDKPPRIGLPTPPHQDAFYWMIEPVEGLTVWIALDPVDEENGCVRYVPGSHLRGMRPHARTQTKGFSQGIADFGDEDRAAEMGPHLQPGDVLVHHAMTIHRADGNTSDRHRRALGAVYFSRRSVQDAERLAAYQKTLER
jgi:phytanoyl-CoA hydroxylase